MATVRSFFHNFKEKNEMKLPPLEFRKLPKIRHAVAAPYIEGRRCRVAT